MNKKALILITVIILSIVGGLFYLLNQNSQTTETSSTTPTSTDEAAAPSNGNYVDYSDSAVAETSGTKLIFFHAPWCPQCRDLEDDIEARGVPEGVTIFKADYDTSHALRQKYGVTLQTTVVKIDDNGNLIKKFVAYDTPTLDSIVKNLL